MFAERDNHYPSRSGQTSLATAVTNFTRPRARSICGCSVLGPKWMLTEHDNRYPSRSGQTSLATAVTNITKSVTKINFWPSMSYLGLLDLACYWGESRIRSQSHGHWKRQGFSQGSGKEKVVRAADGKLPHVHAENVKIRLSLLMCR